MRPLILCALLSGLIVVAALSAETGGIKGKVIDKRTGQPLIGANVTVEGTTLGAATGSDGTFDIPKVPAGTYVLVVSYVGFEKARLNVTVSADQTAAVTAALAESTVAGQEIVITASRRPEKLTDAPATISVISAQNIAELPSFNVGELLSRQKGVEYIRTGVLGTGINVRGFNSAFNPKNLLLIDARISTLVAPGLPLGPFATVVKDDIERTEVILGPAGALYGPNAHNGLVNTITKDPRTSQGTTAAVSVGNQSVFDGRLRYADVINDQWAYKVSAEYYRGQDFNYVDSVYVGGVGYQELDLDRDFNGMRGEAALYYSLNPESDVILSYGGSNSNNIAQTNAGRNQIKDWQVHYLQARYVSPRVFAQFYHTWSSTNDTYAMNQRTQNYRSFIAAGFGDEEARRRSFLEAWTGTKATGRSLPRGSIFIDKSRRVNGEVQYNNSWEGFQVTIGAQGQRDIANSEKSYLLDQDGAITLDQFGLYGQVEKALGESGLKVVLAARADKHDLYGSNIIPRAALLYSGGGGTWRVTYGKGIASPTILNLSANIFGGLLLGNGEGFTLSNGTKVSKLEVETIQTFELGYKGVISEKLFVDANAYYNISENFISPALNISTPAGVLVTHRGSRPMQEVVPGTPAAGSAFVLTYLNFGKVNTYGADFGINLYVNDNVNLTANYSYFNFNLDRNDLRNDGNKDGKVTDTDLPINAAKHKGNIGLNVRQEKWFGSVFARWVAAFDFFSGINVAAQTNTDVVVSGDPVRENARVGRTWNYGPLGNFVNVDVSAGYRISDNLTLSAQVVNLFDSKVREFVASPFIGRLVSTELTVTF